MTIHLPTLHHRRALTLACALLLAASSAQAIYKCPSSGGTTVFQDQPCAGGKLITVKPAAGPTPAPPQSKRLEDAGVAPMASAASDAASAAAPAVKAPASAGQTEAERIEAETAASAKARRKLSLERDLIPDAQTSLVNTRAVCQRGVDDLRKRHNEQATTPQGRVNASNLAEQMGQLADRCDKQDRMQVHQLNTMLKECRDLGGCANLNAP